MKCLFLLCVLVSLLRVSHVTLSQVVVEVFPSRERCSQDSCLWVCLQLLGGDVEDSVLLQEVDDGPELWSA